MRGSAARVAYDPVAAKKLMNEAGYEQRLRGDVRLLGGSRGQRSANLHGDRRDAATDRRHRAAQRAAAIEALRQDSGRPLDLLHDELGRAADDRRARHAQHRYAHPAGIAYGTWNLGGYSNPKIDELVHRIEVEIDGPSAMAEIREALQMHKDDVGHIPIHTQHSAWAVRDGIRLRHAADDFVRLENVMVEK